MDFSVLSAFAQQAPYLSWVQLATSGTAFLVYAIFYWAGAARDKEGELANVKEQLADALRQYVPSIELASLNTAEMTI